MRVRPAVPTGPSVQQRADEQLIVRPPNLCFASTAQHWSRSRKRPARQQRARAHRTRGSDGGWSLGAASEWRVREWNEEGMRAWVNRQRLSPTSALAPLGFRRRAHDRRSAAQLDTSSRHGMALQVTTHHLWLTSHCASVCFGSDAADRCLTSTQPSTSAEIDTPQPSP